MVLSDCSTVQPLKDKSERLTQVIGTKRVHSPEKLTRPKVSFNMNRTWSLGVTAYELLFGAGYNASEKDELAYVTKPPQIDAKATGLCLRRRQDEAASSKLLKHKWCALMKERDVALKWKPWLVHIDGGAQLKADVVSPSSPSVDSELGRRKSSVVEDSISFSLSANDPSKVMQRGLRMAMMARRRRPGVLSEPIDGGLSPKAKGADEEPAKVVAQYMWEGELLRASRAFVR